MGIRVKLSNVRIGWVDVYKKAADRVNSQGQQVEGQYQLTAYLDKDDPQIEKIEDAVAEVMTGALGSASAAEKWMSKNFGFGNHADKCAFRDLAQRDSPIEGLEEGLYFMAKSRTQPMIATSEGEVQCQRGGRVVKGLTEAGDDVEGKEVYSGCYANIVVDVYWYSTYKNLGVELLGVRFKDDGEAFGGARATVDLNDLEDDEPAPRRERRRRG